MNDVLTVIDAKAHAQPDHLIYSFLNARGAETHRFTRAAFLERVQSIARHLCVEERLEPASRVVLAYPSGLEMIAAFFGCVWAGMIPVPVAAPTSHAVEQALYKIRFIAEDCGAALIMTSAETAEIVSRFVAGQHATSEEATWIATRRLLASDAIPTTGTSFPRGTAPILFLQYTSGTTSSPKGVMVTHDNILTNAAQFVDHPDPIGVSWLPQHHDMGLIGYYINNAVSGGTLYGFSPTSFIQRPSLWLETISRYRATATSAPNFAFEHCMRPGRMPQSVLDTLDLGSLKLLQAAAEPIKPSTFRDFLAAFAPYGLRPEAFHVAYGMAENTLGITAYGRRTLSVHRQALAEHRVRRTNTVAEVSAATHLMSCGTPQGDTDIRIVDPETRVALGSDQVGEIWVSGRSKCAGYWGRKEASRETFEARIEGDPPGTTWLRTGDMGFRHDGELYVCGRRKDMIIVRGQNHYPQDIELLVERWSDAVRAGGVAAFELEEDGASHVVIAAEIAPGKAAPDGAEILAAIRRYLGIEIDRIVFVPPKSIPRTTSGKAMRFMTARLLADGELRVLGETASQRALQDGPAAIAPDSPFASFRARYGLHGNEEFTLLEAGLDSFDLVVFLHELTEFLSERGAAEIAETIDHRLLQALTVAELFRLIARFENDPDTALDKLRRVLDQKRGQADEAELQLMAADRYLSFTPPAARASADPASPQRVVLLTGACGFLGPFLLSSLLEQTDADIRALVRAKSAEEGRARLRDALGVIAAPASVMHAFESRVEAVIGDLERPGLGLAPDAWTALADEVDTIYHNGALVNYLFTYRRMRSANVVGTNELLRFAFAGRPKVMNYVSTTFIFGWATKDVLSELDCNADMELLDFGYSQSKWVAEQLVIDAKRHGLTTRIFRPALITPSLEGRGGGFDITLRLLAFMVRHGVSVNALNQVSFMPADVTAANIVAISNEKATAHGTYHVTRDHYANMIDVIDIIRRMTGRRFEMVDLPAFVPEVIRRCTIEDPLFPLLDFLVNSVDNISAMEFKRYDSARYMAARDMSPNAVPDPSLEATVHGILQLLRVHGMSELNISIEAGAAEPIPS